MTKETFRVIECIPIRDFKHKMQVTKDNIGKAKVEILEGDYIYIERIESEAKTNAKDKAVSM